MIVKSSKKITAKSLAYKKNKNSFGAYCFATDAEKRNNYRNDFSGVMNDLGYSSRGIEELNKYSER